MSSAPLAPPPESFRIAVLDDNATSRVLIERILRRHFGCQVRTFGEPEELWAACSENPPDLFLIDIVLGDKNGIDVCRDLKASPITREVPVIFFSEYGQPRTRIEALRAGGVDYLDKPFFPEEFLQRVRGSVERFRHQKMLETQTKEQQALLQVLCHDLRNSVGATVSILQMIQEAGGARERDDYVDLSIRAARSALDLIAHVAEYRSLLDESRPFKLEPVDVPDACAESVNVLGTAAGAKGIRLRVEVPPGLLVTTNRVVLVHNILNNLVSNAVKFSLPGSTVWISARADDTPDSNDCIFTVRDEGIGIPPATLEKLLRHEPVGSRPGTAREPGTGLGLNLVDLYARRCGGRLFIASQTLDPARPDLRPGTTVTVRLPLKVPPSS